MSETTPSPVRKIVAIGVGISWSVVLSRQAGQRRSRSANASLIAAALAGAGVQVLLARRAAHDVPAQPAPAADDQRLADRGG